ncbi:RloB domain-containing protein [Candidatus Poribacteria bacterium]|nr:RloB domain-containing protein [Candidatus Poribacteria bacterium]
MRKRTRLSQDSPRLRARATRLPAKTILVVTEGRCTEPAYLRALQKRLKLVTVQVVHPKATDPKNLVEEAVRLKQERERQARHGEYVAFDEVWVLFDHEAVHNGRRGSISSALDMGRAAKLKFARSNPCFEFWLLLHYEFTTAPFESCDKVTVRLKRHWPNFEKSAEPPEDIMELVHDAEVHAERCRKHHEETGGDGNPSTDVDLLVKELRKAVLPHNENPRPEPAGQTPLTPAPTRTA